jgi:prepilin-type N-terminal cleavage/methylation domain-containing protein
MVKRADGTGIEMTTMENGINQLRIERQSAAMFSTSIANRQSPIVNFRAFTLIELLVVISIITLIAALLLPVAGSAQRLMTIHSAQAEMAQLETAIDRYKSVYGFYPPDNHQDPANPMINQLYYELIGTTNTAGPGNSPVYQPLGGGSSLNTNDLFTAFGVIGLMNCNKPAADESAPQARNFLQDLKPDQIGAVTITNNITGYVAIVSNLVVSAGGPARTYQPLGVVGMNPWRYNSSSPTNNPGSYDLWVQLAFGQQMNLICNWKKQVEINNPLP